MKAKLVEMLVSRERWLALLSHRAFHVLLFGLVYALGALAGVVTDGRPGAPLFWPPAGLLLGVLLLTPRGMWAYLAGVAFFVDLAAQGLIGVPVLAALVQAGIVVGEALGGTVILIYIMGRKGTRFDEPRGIFLLTTVAPFVIPVIGASLRVAAARLGLVAGSVGEDWLWWWSHDALGVLVFAPLFPCASAMWREGVLSPWRVAEGLTALTGLAVLAALAFHGGHSVAILNYPLLTVPFLLWLSLRLRIGGGAAGVVVFVLVGVAFSTRGMGLYAIAPDSLPGHVLLLRGLLGMYGYTFLFIGAVLMQREQVLRHSRETEHRLRALFDAMHEGCCLFEILRDAAGGAYDLRFIRANQACARLAGVPAQELAGKRLRELLPHMRRSTVERYVQAAENNDSARFVEFSVDLGRWFEVNSYSPFPGQCVLVFSDITERRQFVESLRERELQLNQAQRIAGMGFVTHDLERNVAQISEEGLAILGLGANAPVHVGTLGELVHAEDRAEYDRWMAALRQGRDMPALEYRVVRADGQTRIVLSNSLVESRKNGLARRLLVTLLDITHVRGAERELQARTEVLEQFFTSSLDLLCIADTSGVFIRLSKEWERALGYSIAELEGRRYIEFVHPDDVANTLEKTQQLASQEEVANFINRYRRKDGTYRWIEWRSHPCGEAVYATARDVTKRVEAEQRLVSSERKLALHNRIAGIFLTMPGYEMYPHVLDVVLEELKSRYGIFGYLDERGDLVTPSMTAEIWDECKMADKDIVFPRETWGATIWARALREGKTLYANSPMRTPPGHIAITRAMAVPIVHGEGVIGIFTVGNKETDYDADDIGTLETIAQFVAPILAARLERDRAEVLALRRAHELHRSEQLFRDYFNLPLVGACISGPDMRFQFVNDKLCAMLGYTREELVAMTWAEITPVEERGAEIEMFNSYLHARVDCVTFEKRYVCKDGSIISVNISTQCIWKEDGEPDYLVSLVQDVTERKQAEAALRASEERFRSVVEQTPDVIWSIDLKGAFTFLSPAAREVLGYDPSELVGKAASVVLTPESAEQARAYAARGLEGHWSGEVEEYVHVRKDGSTFVGEIRSTPLRGPDGGIVGIHGITRDVTERKRLEQQLIQAQKLESIGQLAGGVAHDFNNLLAVILGYSDILKAQVLPEAPENLGLDEIIKAGERAKDLTGQLLAFSRKQVLAMRDVHVNEVVGAADKMLRRLIGEHIHVWIELAADMDIVRADASQMTQVLLNLSVNARDAMPNGGILKISTESIFNNREDELASRGLRLGPYVLLTISDTGMGMTPEVLQHAFEPFFTTKEKGRGTGLGLATVFGIVKQHGGDITVQSELGHGTTFRVYLPVSETAQMKMEDEVEREMALGCGETVLVMEDEDNLRMLVCEMLRRLNYTVLQAGTFDECLAIVREQVQLDLLLTDVIMPGMNGRQVYETLKNHFPSMRVLFMSGYTDDIIAHHGILEKGINFIAKPFTQADLSFKLREAIALEAPAGPVASSPDRMADAGA